MSALWGRLAQSPDTQCVGTRGPSEALGCRLGYLHLTHSPGNRSKPRITAAHGEEEVGETGWQPELEAIALTNSGLVWHRAIQSCSRDFRNMHIRCALTVRPHRQSPSLRHTPTHKAAPGEYIVWTWSICEIVFIQYKQARDPLCTESCSLNPVNLQN